MFEEIIFMVSFAVFSVVMSYILLVVAPHPLNKFFQVLAVLGIVIHEFCHVLMCLLTGTRIRTMKILEHSDDKSKFGLKYGGRIELEEFNKLTFLQALLIGFAPLYISFWLFFFLWEQLKNPSLEVVIFYLYIFIMVSLMLSAAPSLADLFAIIGSFQFDWRYSLYQICLLLLSIWTVWFGVIYFQFEVFHEILTYFLILFGYHVYKYGFKGLRAFNQQFLGKRSSFGSERGNIKKLTRRRVKPAKSRREAQW
jgi:hypothetical protein